MIVVGEENIKDLGKFLKRLNTPRRVSLISGTSVRRIVVGGIEESLRESGIGWAWHETRRNDLASIAMIQSEIESDESSLIAGIGGGRAVDIAKMIAFNLKIPFASIPTAASHDGIASPFVSIIGKKPHSVVATAPLGVFIDIGIIKKAPRRLLASGCGDLVANIIAVRDWELGRDRNNEYYGRYAADLAMMSARIVMENARTFAEGGIDERVVVEALISAGVASCIAGSSRPCSGAEHLFSHAMDKLAPGTGLHGEKCGIGAIMMAKLQGQDWERIACALRDVGAPTSAEEVGIRTEDLVEALIIAQDLRPDRYTILKEVKMDREKALDLARTTKVI